MPTDDIDARSASPAPTAGPSSAVRWLGRIVRLLLVVAVLAVGGGISFYWMTHKPKAERRPPQAQAALVEVSRVLPEKQTVVVGAMGTVVPARSIQLAARVGGQVIDVSSEFAPGGRFKAGEIMARIDPNDYELAVRRQETEVARSQALVEQRAGEVLQRISDVTRAESALALEMGQQEVAQREYELLGSTVVAEDRDLVLRQPQLRTAEAARDAAKAAKRSAEGTSKAAEAAESAAMVALETAELDLARTTIRAPFNAMVQSRNVDLGAQVAVGAPLAPLVDTDEYWVQVSVPLGQLRWIRIPGVNGATASAVRVYHEAAWGAGAFRAGEVVRLMTDLEPQGRMARLLVAVKDPLGLKRPPEQRRPMILGAYVRVEIDGRELPGVIRVARTALRDGDRVWVMQADRTLDVRKVKIVWGGLDHVFVTDGLHEGDLLVTSDLAAPVQGMALRRAGSGARESSTQPVGKPAPEAASEARR